MSDATQSIPKRTLLQKYDIPVEFLDFEYVGKCEDPRMLEKIVKILRSGEEGFYPQLTDCAEKKLLRLKPDSKMFRTETVALKKECLSEEERTKLNADMDSWINEMKEVDVKVKEIQPKGEVKIPIRKARNIKEESDDGNNAKPVDRIKSTDYGKWEKFDVDAAVMKIDLEEERQRELVALKNKKNCQKIALIEEIVDDEVDGLSEFEKSRLAESYKDKGNECFKAKEYDEAIKEYTQSLRIKKTAAAFNNRALIYLKQKKFLKALSDTNDCLMIEPGNIKALLRKAQALQGEKMLAEAFDTYEKILEFDKDNSTAKSEIQNLRGKIPPRNAFRMKIEDVSDVTQAIGDTKPKPTVKKSTKTEKLEFATSSNVVPKMVQNIIIDEPNPFDKLKPKDDKKPRESLLMPGQQQTSDKPDKKKILIQEMS